MSNRAGQVKGYENFYRAGQGRVRGNFTGQGRAGYAEISQGRAGCRLSKSEKDRLQVANITQPAGLYPRANFACFAPLLYEHPLILNVNAFFSPICTHRPY
jgi:hypothetical protein